ncbi:MAG TPA: hypothetical protein VMS92_05210 [Mycobacterium sp.]|nr:hypothetical protein [Mycobacterium sp.]
MYKAYLPRLRERFRETSEEDQFDEYPQTISSFVVDMAREALGPTRLKIGPWHHSFFVIDETR